MRLSPGTLPFCTFCILLGATATFPCRANGEIRLIGTARLPGDSTDLSGLTDELPGGIPHNRLGGISGIEYTGKDDRYLLLSDRGPADGATAYRCRFHELKFTVEAGRAPALGATLVSTTLLENETGRPLTGSA